MNINALEPEMDIRDEIDLRLLSKLGFIVSFVFKYGVSLVSVYVFKKSMDKFINSTDKLTEKQKNIIKKYFTYKNIALLHSIYSAIVLYKFAKKTPVIDELKNEVGLSLIEAMGYVENDTKINIIEKSGLKYIDHPNYEFDNFDANKKTIIASLNEIPDYDFHSIKTGEFLYDTGKNSNFLSEFWQYLKTYNSEDVYNCFRFETTRGLEIIEDVIPAFKLKKRRAKTYSKIGWESETDSGNMRGLLAPSFVAFGTYFDTDSDFQTDFVFKLIPAYSNEHFTNVGDFYIQDIFKDIAYGFYGGGKILLPTRTEADDTEEKMYTFLLMEKINYIPLNEEMDLNILISCSLDILKTHYILAEGDWLHGDAHIDNNVFCYGSENKMKGVLIDYGNSFRISKIKRITEYKDNTKMVLFMNIIDPLFSVLMKILKRCFDNLGLHAGISMESFNIHMKKHANEIELLFESNKKNINFSQISKFINSYLEIQKNTTIQMIIIKNMLKIKTQNIFLENEKGYPAYKNIENNVNKLIKYIKICDKGGKHDIEKLKRVANIFINGIKKVTELWNSQEDMNNIKKIYAETYDDLYKISHPETGNPAGGEETGIGTSIGKFLIVIILVAIIILLVLIVLSGFLPFLPVSRSYPRVQVR